MVQLTVASRLHLGLLSLPQQEEPPSHRSMLRRRFGGAGLMVKDPGLSLTIAFSSQWKATGPHHHRALDFAQTYARQTQLEQAFEITIHHAPLEHIGLGVGTQLGLAVARGIAQLVGHSLDVVELAKRVGRGHRSAIGIHGSHWGGFLVEAGKLPQETISPLIFQHPVPNDWRVILVIPKSGGVWHGEQEKQAFSRFFAPAHLTDTLCRILLLQTIPALKTGDFCGFAEGIEEFNTRVGEMFSAVQGGIYSSPLVHEVVNRLKSLGAKGVGQSSWGPTVFALAPNPQEADRLVKACPFECLVTRVWNGEMSENSASLTEPPIAFSS